LIGDTKLTAITLTDASKPTLVLTLAGYTADSSGLAKIGSAYNLKVTGATVASAASLQAAALVTFFTIADTAANVQATLSLLIGDTKLTAIRFTDASRPTLVLTYADYTAGSSVLAKISSAFNLEVTGATVASAAGLHADPLVTSFTIADTAAAIVAGLPSLTADISHITSIAATDTIVAVTVAQFTANTVNKIIGGFDVSDTAASILLEADIGQIDAITANTGTVTASVATFKADATALNKVAGGFDISDAGSTIGANIALLEADIGAIDGITLTDASKPTLVLRLADYTADSSVLAKIGSAYNLKVTGATVASAASLQAAPLVTFFTIADTAANVQATLSLLIGDTKLTAIRLTDAARPTLVLTYADYTADSFYGPPVKRYLLADALSANSSHFLPPRMVRADEVIE
jgi:hypothetical protein